MVIKEEIELAKTPNGGWTKDQLSKWGVQWPPPKGWKKELEGNSNENQSSSIL